MVSRTLTHPNSRGGLRRMDPARDLGRIADLLEIAFAEELAGGGQAILRDLHVLGYMGPLLWVISRSAPFLGDLLSGFVWEEDGHIVGNATVSRARNRSAWIISNVAVLPAYRGRGIGRRLMEAAIEHARSHGGRQVVLQVRRDNEPAKRLYQSLGFHTVGVVHELHVASAQERPWFSPPGVAVRLPDPNHWRAARRLALEAVPQAVQIFQPVRSAEFRTPPLPGLAEWARYFLLGYRRQQWWAEYQGHLVGLLTAERHRGTHPSTFEIILPPEGRTLVEASLLRRALRFLRGRAVRVQVLDEYHAAIRLLREAGFTERRVLDTMLLEL